MQDTASLEIMAEPVNLMDNGQEASQFVPVSSNNIKLAESFENLFACTLIKVTAVILVFH